MERITWVQSWWHDLHGRSDSSRRVCCCSKLGLFRSQRTEPRQKSNLQCLLLLLGLAATAVAKSAVETRPLGIAKHSAFTESEFAVFSGEAGSARPGEENTTSTPATTASKVCWGSSASRVCKVQRSMRSLQQPRSLLAMVKLGLLDLQSRVPRRTGGQRPKDRRPPLFLNLDFEGDVSDLRQRNSLLLGVGGRFYLYYMLEVGRTHAFGLLGTGLHCCFFVAPSPSLVTRLLRWFLAS